MNGEASWIKRIIDWLSSNLELGSAITLLTGSVIFLGDVYYTAYFEQYSIPRREVMVSFLEYLKISLVYVIVTAFLLALMVASKSKSPTSFVDALKGNTPLLVLLFLIAVVFVDLYWSNVRSMSSWLSVFATNSELKLRYERNTKVVEYYLRWAVIVAPMAIAILTTVVLSIRKKSFSYYVLKRSATFRGVGFVAYIFLVIYVAETSGKVTAFLESIGVFKTQQVTITLKDRANFENQELFYVGRSENNYFFAKQRVESEDRSAALLVPIGNVLSIRFEAPRSEAGRAADLLRDYYLSEGVDKTHK